MVEYWGRDFYHPAECSEIGLDRRDKPVKHALRAPPGVDDPYALLTSVSNALYADTGGYIQRPAAVVHEYAANQCGYKGWRGMFHYGRIDVLLIDGHVEALELDRLAGSASAASIWTRQAD